MWLSALFASVAAALPPRVQGHAGESRPVLRRWDRIAYPPATAPTRTGACTVRIAVDARGRALSMAPSPCPEPWFGAVQRTMGSMRFAPARAGGRRVRGEFHLTVRFVGAASGRSPAAAPAEGCASAIVHWRPRRGAEPHPRVLYQPVYHLSAAARQAGLEGGVCPVWFSVDAAGVPTELDVVGCHPLLAETVRAQALETRFEPVLLGGVPVASSVSLLVAFEPAPALPAR